MNDKVTGFTQMSLLQRKSPTHASFQSPKEDNKENSQEESSDQTGDSVTQLQREDGKKIPQSPCTSTYTTAAFLQYRSDVHKREFNFPDHHFQEITSFFLPCTCNHCNGLVSFQSIII